MEHAPAIQVFRSSLGNYDECEIVGRLKTRYVNLMDQRRPDYGIKVTYAHGAVCETNSGVSQRRIVFKLYCPAEGEEAEEELRLVKSTFTKNCHTYFTIKAPVGCPIDYDIESRSYWLPG
jgi:hypothetical protein